MPKPTLEKCVNKGLVKTLVQDLNLIITKINRTKKISQRDRIDGCVLCLEAMVCSE